MRKEILEICRRDFKKFKIANGYCIDIPDKDVKQGLYQIQAVTSRPSLCFDLLPSQYEPKGESGIYKVTGMLFIQIHFKTGTAEQLSITAENIIQDSLRLTDWFYPADTSKCLNLLEARIPAQASNDIGVLHWNTQIINKDLDFGQKIGSTYQQIKIDWNEYRGTADFNNSLNTELNTEI